MGTLYRKPTTLKFTSKCSSRIYIQIHDIDLLTSFNYFMSIAAPAIGNFCFDFEQCDTLYVFRVLVYNI